ncbi:PHP domain-containing protein [Halalkalibacter hemicellulosilyticus]|uniref:PHP domain-containing protein n=1 Tax=Halalkalibacter hemicellulosilyticus TaxID=127886 RepID=UPI0006907E0B|nr:PHP domain-containing protein [Halalkalibacter hemicellulosilyticus]
MRIDLHMHSTHSDGEMDPKEIVDEALRLGLSVISITDHDEISGYFEAKDVAASRGLQLLPGIEINTDGAQGELHILGYGFEPHHPSMMKYVEWRKEERRKWSKKIVAQLQNLGYPINWEDCWQRAGGQVIVRTHIADELVAKGFFSSSKQAYDQLLKKGGQAFVSRSGLSAEAAIGLIHECGGKSFLAHPGLYDWSYSFEALLEAGLDGIEVYYSKHEHREREDWLKRAATHQLLVSVGSDFHGYDSRSPHPIGSVDYDTKQLEWIFGQREGEVEK